MQMSLWICSLFTVSIVRLLWGFALMLENVNKTVTELIPPLVSRLGPTLPFYFWLWATLEWLSLSPAHAHPPPSTCFFTPWPEKPRESRIPSRYGCYPNARCFAWAEKRIHHNTCWWATASSGKVEMEAGVIGGSWALLRCRGHSQPQGVVGHPPGKTARTRTWV